MNEDLLILGAGHSIITGHLPNQISLSNFSTDCFKCKSNQSINSFGLFSDGMNYHTYYPDVKPEEFTPNEAEFIEPVFRMLSECIVSKGYYPVDFSRNGVLRDSMNLLMGQTVNCDHSTDIGNAIGSVKEVYWQESYEENGIKIPAGINAVLKIDGKANPRIARGIMMDPPSIHSNSVTVRFLWEKSHPNMDDYDFYDKMGSYDKDGNLICKVVTKILSYHETSLVSHGADPYAQKIGNNGKIINPVYANQIANQFSDKTVKVNKCMYTFHDFKSMSNVELIHNTMVFNNEIIQQTKTENNMNELTQFINSLFGEGLLSLSEGKTQSKEEVINLIKGLVSSNSSLSTEVESLKNDKTTLEGEITSLKNQIESDKLMVNIGTKHLSDVREKVTADYRKLMGTDNIDENMITLISKADLSTLESLGKNYTVQLDQKFPLKCEKCGSHQVSRASASLNNDDTKDDDAFKPKSTEEAMATLRKNKNK